MVLSRIRSAPSTVSTVMNTAITRGRRRQRGCRVNIHQIQAADTALMIRPAISTGLVVVSRENETRTQNASIP